MSTFQDFRTDLSHPDNIARIKKQLARDGLVTFDGMRSDEELLTLGKHLGRIYPHRDADDRGITRIAPLEELGEESGYRGFTSQELFFHTERSGVENPPEIFLFLCAQPSPIGGESFLVDAKEVYLRLQNDFPEELLRLSAKESVFFGGGENPFPASIFMRHANGNMYIRFRYDELGYFSSPLVRILPHFMELLDEYSLTRKLTKGEGYILNNGRWLHARMPFEGTREMYRVLINPENTTDTSITFGFTVS